MVGFKVPLGGFRGRFLAELEGCYKEPGGIAPI